MGVFIIILWHWRKGPFTRPLCCTILIVMKALLHFPSAIPSRGIQSSCKPAVLHLHSETEPFCLLQLLFTIFFFTYPPFSSSPYFWRFTGKVVAERQVYSLKCAVHWDLASILTIWNVRQLSLFVIWSKVKNDSCWVGTKGWRVAALAAISLEKIDFSQSFKHLAEVLICWRTQVSLPVSHYCSADSTFKNIVVGEKKNPHFPFYP